MFASVRQRSLGSGIVSLVSADDLSAALVSAVILRRALVSAVVHVSAQRRCVLLAHPCSLRGQRAPANVGLWHCFDVVGEHKPSVG